MTNKYAIMTNKYAIMTNKYTWRLSGLFRDYIRKCTMYIATNTLL